MNTICGREYVMGRGILPAGAIKYMVIDVAKDEIVALFDKPQPATRAMLDYAIENKIGTQVAVVADFGLSEPLVVVETY